MKSVITFIYIFITAFFSIAHAQHSIVLQSGEFNVMESPVSSDFSYSCTIMPSTNTGDASGVRFVLEEETNMTFYFPNAMGVEFYVQSNDDVIGPWFEASTVDYPQYTQGGALTIQGLALAPGSYEFLVMSNSGNVHLSFSGVTVAPFEDSDPLPLPETSPVSDASAIQLSSNMNYIAVVSPREEVSSVDFTSGKISNYTAAKAQVSVQYYDGLSRPVQQIAYRASPSGKDLVTVQEYKAWNRSDRSWLPAAFTTNGMYFQNAAIKARSKESNSDTEPYSRPVYENSAVSRVLEQWGPGTAWYTNGKAVKTEYLTNASGGELACARYTTNGSGLNLSLSRGNYAEKVLKVTKTTDENGNVSYSFVNTLGQKILTRQMDDNIRYDTYYVYDDLGNLSFVLPPGSKADSIQPSENFLDNYCYQYRYDSRQRLIEKKLPGRGWEFIVYNKLGQVVATQDAVQRGRTPQQWMFTRYDVFGRVAMTGIYGQQGTVGDTSLHPISLRREQLQQQVSGLQAQWETRNGSSTGTGYGSSSFPVDDTGIINLLTVNWYDDYSFPGASTLTNQWTRSTMTRGLATGSKIYTTDGAASYLSAHYYDDRGRVVEMVKENQVQGTDRIQNRWSFVGELLSSIRTHVGYGQTTVIRDSMQYDHMGRLLTTMQSINGAAFTVLSGKEYNELGQLNIKKLQVNGGQPAVQNITLGDNDIVYSGDSLSVTATASITLEPGFQAQQGSIFSATLTAGDCLQEIQYTYNPRGWLKTQISPEFSMELKYEDATTPQYNGNIAQQLYNGNHSGSKAFGYSYDKLNRLTAAVSTDTTLNETLSYDKMGNIISLIRGGANHGTLNYTYNNSGQSNQLASVSGYQIRNYAYDLNGNATSDGMGKTIEYNILNLPVTVKQNNATIATYTYTAAGEKLRNTGSDGTREYVNGIVYKNGAIEFIVTEEGKAIPNGSTYSYVYNLKDYLGNVRVSIDQYNNQARVVQEDEYYAFGLQKPLYNFSNDNRYLYNGKEKQTDLENQYDYGARFYDPVIARWNVIDAKAEKFHQYSPYAYAINNPLAYVDVDGRDILVAFTGGPTGGGRTVNPNSQDAGTAGRVVREAQRYADEHCIELNTQVITPGWTSGSSVDNALGFIKDNYTKGEKVVLYGYSYGGDFAVELAEALKEQGITVDLLVTVDASDGPAQNSTVDTTIPDNVKENLNYYQTNDSGKSSASQKSGSSSSSSSSSGSSSNSDSGSSNSPGSNGGSNSAANSKRTKVNNVNKTGAGVNHGNIDEKVNKDVQKRIREVLGGGQ